MENLPGNLDVWPVGVLGKDPRVHASAGLGRKAIETHAERMTGILSKALERI